MKNKLIQISATTPTFATLIVYLVSLVFLLIGVTSLSGDILSFLVMGLVGIVLLVISLSLLYFKLLSQYIYERLKLEVFVAMGEKNQALVDEFAKNDYQIIEKSPKYILEKKSEFNIYLFIVYLVIVILPGIIYLIVISEIGRHTISFELGGKVYKDVTIDMQTNKLKYNE